MRLGCTFYFWPVAPRPQAAGRRPSTVHASALSPVAPPSQAAARRPLPLARARDSPAQVEKPVDPPPPLRKLRMRIDRSWMTLTNRACNEYEKGIDAFLDFAFKRLGNVKRIRCPCAKCCNVRLKSRTEVKYDLFRNGILLSYTKWHHHGELSDESNSESDADDANTPIDERCKNMETKTFGARSGYLRGLGCGPKPLSAKNLTVKASEEYFERQIDDLKEELKQSRVENEERESLVQREKNEREERFKKEIEEIEGRIKKQIKTEFNEQLKIIVELYGVPTASPPSSSRGVPTTSSPPASQND